MKFKLLCGTFILCLSACNNKHSADFIVSSTGVLDEQMYLSIYGETQGEQTHISANLYKNHSKGYRQYLVLEGEDALSASHVDWRSEFVPTVAEPLISYYDVDYDAGEAGDIVSIELIRDSDISIAVELTVLSETTFTVTYDAEPISLQSTIASSWEAIEGYRYSMEFAFSCDSSEGKKIGFHRHYPNRTMDVLVSPFSLDLGQLSSPPSDAVNCSVTVSLLSEQSQNDLQVLASDRVNVYAARKQSEEVLIDNSAVE